MAKTHGRKPLPLPIYLRERLLGLGMVEMPETEPPLWRHPMHPPLRLQMVASNIPNETLISVHLNGAKPQRMQPDAIIALMEFRLQVAGTPNRVMADPKTHDSERGTR